MTLLSPADSQATSSVTLRVSTESHTSEPPPAGAQPYCDVSLENEPTPIPHLVRILSLDGGGVRGLSSLLILREIMVQLQDSKSLGSQKTSTSTPASLKPCDFFELIVGTGTGGLSALSLGRLHMTVDEAITEYIGLISGIPAPIIQSVRRKTAGTASSQNSHEVFA